MSDATSTPPAAPPLPPKRNDHPARDLWVGSLLDPAFDRAHASWKETSARYSETRAAADLRAMPVILGQRPTLWRLRPLSITARQTVLTSTSYPMQRLLALRLGLVERVDGAELSPEGAPVGVVPVVLKGIEGSVTPQLTDEAMQGEVDAWGGYWLDEIADVILARMDLSPRRYLPFPLPLPSALLT